MTLSQDMLIDYLRNSLNMDDPIAGDTELFSTGMMDSVGMVGLIAFVEENTGLRVQPNDVTLDNFDTIDAILAYVRSLG